MNQQNNYVDELKVVQSMVNPFLPYKFERKWPDGLATHSCSVTHRKHTRVLLRPNMTNSGVYHVILFAGKTNWCVLYNDFNNDFNNYQPEEDHLLVNHNDNGRHFPMFRPTYTIEDPTFEDLYVTPHPEKNEVLNWRPVTVGMKIYVHINGHQTTNGGYYTAYRIPTSAVLRDHTIMFESTDPEYVDPLVPSFLYPSHYTGDVFPRVPKFTLKDIQLVYYPSGVLRQYDAIMAHRLENIAVGELKNLNDVVFQLNNNKRYNEFLPNQMSVYPYYVGRGYPPIYKQYPYEYKAYHPDDDQNYFAFDGNQIYYKFPSFDTKDFQWNRNDTNPWTRLASKVSYAFDAIVVTLYTSQNTEIILETEYSQELQLMEGSKLHISSPGYYLPPNIMQSKILDVYDSRKYPYFYTDIPFTPK